jgi:hypothetical protein
MQRRVSRLENEHDTTFDAITGKLDEHDAKLDMILDLLSRN